MHLKPSTKRNRSYVVLSLGERFWPKVAKSDDPHGCWLWTASTFGKGYGQILREGKPYRTMGAHVAAYELASGQPVPDGFDVAHTCDVRLCVRNDEPGVYAVDGVEYPRFGHLFLTTNAVNARDMTLKGRHVSRSRPDWAARGERVTNARLTAIEVLAIRSAHAAGEANAQALASRFGINESTIHRIVSRITWKHLP